MKTFKACFQKNIKIIESNQDLFFAWMVCWKLSDERFPMEEYGFSISKDSAQKKVLNLVTYLIVEKKHCKLDYLKSQIVQVKEVRSGV